MASTWTEESPGFDPEFEDVPDKGTPPPTERLAVLSLVSGIAGFFLPVVGPVTAIVSGHVARGEIRKAGGRLGGDGLAKTGLLLGYVWLGFTVLAVAGVLSIRTVSSGARHKPEVMVIRSGEKRHHLPDLEAIEGANFLVRPVEPPLPDRPRATVRLLRPDHPAEVERPVRPPGPPGAP